MPVLRKYLDRDGFYVITSIKGSVVTYQLSTDGAEKLRKAGIKPGDKFNRFVLLDLYQSGDVFTGHSGTGEAVLSVHPGQGEFDFKNDPEPESALPMSVAIRFICCHIASPPFQSISSASIYIHKSLSAVILLSITSSETPNTLPR